MIRAIETVFGCIALVALVACMPRILRDAQLKAAEPLPGSCKTTTHVQMLCDRVTPDGKHECGICIETGCTTVTGIYCARSCDDTACIARPK